VNQRRAYLRARLRQHAKPPQTLPAVFLIRMTHIERALHAADPDAASRCFPAEARGQLRGHLIRHVGQPGACI